MYRKLASALLVASAISSQYAVAVSLGEITMHSALNEPLKADIKLSNAESLDSSQLAIKLASSEEFERAGIERTFFHSDINFSIELDGKGAGIVHLSSKRRLNEPFLDILLESKWPTGRMLRSYTVLVDLPVYEEPQAVTVDAPKAAVESKPAVATKSREQQVATAAKSSRIEHPNKKAADSHKDPIVGEQYRTQRNDTLWVIAKRISQGQGISINQAMLSIQSENPHAFINGNINQLKAGVVLRLPTVDAMQSISNQSAQQMVSQHNQQWKNAQLDGTEAGSTIQRSPNNQRQGSLRLTSAGTGSAAGKDANVAGSQQLTAAQDEIAAVNLENKELGSKVESLSSQVEQLQRLIELKNAELASLQKQLGKDVSKPADAAAKAKADAAEKSATDKVAAKLDEKKPQLDTPVKSEKAKTEKKPTPVKPVPAQAEQSLVDKVSQNPIYIGILGLLIAVGVGGFLLRRRAQAEKQLLEDNDSFSFDDMDEDDLSAGDSQVEAFEEDVDAQQEAVEPETLETFEEDEDAVLQTGDAIGEADIYVAYGRYDQAASLLKAAISKSPNNAALRSKLLEIYVAADDKEGFQQAFVELQERGEHDAVAEAKELLSTSDSASDWLTDLPEATEQGDDLDELDLDGLEDSFDLDAQPDDELAGFETDVSEDFNLDLDASSDLDEDLSGFASEVSEDFNLDLSGDSELGDDLSGFEGDITEDLGLDLTSDGDLSLDDTLEESDELDLSDAFSLDDSAFIEETAPDSAIEEDLGDLSLGDDLAGLDDLSADFSALDDTQLDLDAGQEVDESASDDDTLSLDEFDLNLDLESPIEGDGLATDSLSLDGLDLGADIDDTQEEVVSSFEADEEDVLSLDDLDFSADETDALSSVTADTAVSEESEPELSLDDFDLDFDDLTADTDVADSVSDVESPEVEVDVAPISPLVDDQPHVSAELESLGDDDFAFIDSADEVATKLDLAQAYVDMGDVDGAREILLEVLREGNDDQRGEANVLMSSLD